MEPFPAQTPLPDLSLVDPVDQELLARASLLPGVPPPMIESAIPAPRGSLPPSDLATIDEALTDPAMLPPRRTRPPIGSAVSGAPAAISDDLLPAEPKAVPRPALDSDDVGKATDDLDGDAKARRLSKRQRRVASISGTSPGEYAYKSTRKNRAQPSGTPTPMPMATVSGTFTDLDDKLENASHSLNDATTINTRLSDSTGTLRTERRRMQWFATGMIVGVLLGAVISVLVVLVLGR